MCVRGLQKNCLYYDELQYAQYMYRNQYLFKKYVFIYHLSLRAYNCHTQIRIGKRVPPGVPLAQCACVCASSHVRLSACMCVCLFPPADQVKCSRTCCITAHEYRAYGSKQRDHYFILSPWCTLGATSNVLVIHRRMIMYERVIHWW